jgi:hypothetical protein
MEGLHFTTMLMLMLESFTCHHAMDKAFAGDQILALAVKRYGEI